MTKTKDLQQELMIKMVRILRDTNNLDEYFILLLAMYAKNIVFHDEVIEYDLFDGQHEIRCQNTGYIIRKRMTVIKQR